MPQEDICTVCRPQNQNLQKLVVMPCCLSSHYDS